MYFIINPVLKRKCIECTKYNRIHFLFLHLSVKSEVEEQLSHKVAAVISVEVDVDLLASLQQLYQLKLTSWPVCSSYIS